MIHVKGDQITFGRAYKDLTRSRTGNRVPVTSGDWLPGGMPRGHDRAVANEWKQATSTTSAHPKYL